MIPIFTAVSAAIGIGSSIAGLFGGPSDSDIDKANALQKRASNLSKKVEKQRQLQMNLEARQRLRQAVREMVVGQAVALTNATNSGAGQSSGLAGGLAQVTSEGFQNALGILQAQKIGNKIFDLNTKITDTQTQFNKVSSQIQSDQQTSQALMSFGQSLLGNSTTIGNVGASLFGGS